MKAEKTSYWVLLGPLLLLAIVALLLFETGDFLAQPLWLLGLIVSTLLACAISYLAFLEVGRREKQLQLKESNAEKTATDLRYVLDETHLLYRDKVFKLEKTVSAIEEGHLLQLKEYENGSLQMQKSYEELFEKSNDYKNQAYSFQIALEDALSQMRDYSQRYYLLQEIQQQIPSDLMHQHQQLREQFDEKSLVLDQTRRRLFLAEGLSIALKKEKELTMLDRNDEQEHLIEQFQVLLQENKALEKEILALEQLVAAVIKPTSARKATKKLSEMLELQFDISTSRSY